jgi:predicted nucleic acid-binding protein
MTDSERIFFDSSPFVYLVENHPKYYFPVANLLADLLESNTGLITSVVTISEIYVKPLRDGNEALIKDMGNVLKSLNFTVAEIDFKIAELSATLRAKYAFLKGLDSLQVATALSYNCRRFFTNDKKLKQITELEILLVDNLI